MKNYRVRHIRSSVVENNLPKLPTPAQLEFGEIAINYAAGYETLSIKNTSGDVVTFSPGYKVDDLRAEVARRERVISASLNDLNDRVTDIEEGGNVQELSGSVITLSGTVDELESAFTEFVANAEEEIEILSGNVTTISGVVVTLNSHQVSGTSAITVTESNNKSTVELVINSNDKVLTQDASGLLSNLSLDIANDGKTVYLKGKDNQTISSINTSTFVKDGMLDNVVLSGNTLIFTFNIDSGKQQIEVPLSGFVGIYTVSAGSENYLEITDYKVGTKVDVTNGLASKNSVDGLASSAATSANTLNSKINTEVANAIASAATSANTLNEIIKSDERITSTALNALNCDVANAIASAATSANTLNEIIKENEEVIAVAIERLTTKVTELVSTVDENEEVTATALTDLDTRISSIVNELTSIKSRLSQLENS